MKPKKIKAIIKLRNKRSSGGMQSSLKKAEEVKQGALDIVDVVSGVITNSKEDNVLAAARIAKAFINGSALQQTQVELVRLRGEGLIRQGVSAKESRTFYEYLRFIDEDVPDEERLKAMKSIFLNSLLKDRTDMDREVAYQLMLVCRQLSSMEILILRACSQLKSQLEEFSGNLPKVKNPDPVDFKDWLGQVSNIIGYDLPELIVSTNDHLVSLGLLTRRYGDQGSRIMSTRMYRLTVLGVRLCEHITVFDEHRKR